jgi:hypothetical protein
MSKYYNKNLEKDETNEFYDELTNEFKYELSNSFDKLKTIVKNNILFTKYINMFLFLFLVIYIFIGIFYFHYT